MSTGTGGVVVLELNEITWTLLQPLIDAGSLPSFAAMQREGTSGRPLASEESKHLDPWVTWTTVYTGVPQHVHGLSMLEQDVQTVGAKRIWDYVAGAGRSVGLFGSANSWPPKRVAGFWIPGPFSADFQTYPPSLEPVQALNVGLTRGHTAGLPKPSMRSLAPQLMRLGLRPSTMVRMARTMLEVRSDRKRTWKLVSLQPLVNADIFAAVYRKHRPAFSTLHSNHVAYYQHRFWRAMDPSAFEVRPSDEERQAFAGCIEYGYLVADEIVGRLRRLVGPDGTLVILSSCGQQPATGGRYSEDQRAGNAGLQIRIGALLSALELRDGVTHSNLMAPQWKLDFTDPAVRERAAQQLLRAMNVTRSIPCFAVELAAESICLGARREQKLDDELELCTTYGARRFKAGELLEQHAEVVKSGRHHPEGVLLMAGPGVRPAARVEECDNLDLAPTLMHLLGEPVPDVMQGRILTEALVE